MYIPEFFCGVIATVIFEVALIIGFVIYFGLQKKDGDDEESKKID